MRSDWSGLLSDFTYVTKKLAMSQPDVRKPLCCHIHPIMEDGLLLSWPICSCFPVQKHRGGINQTPL